MPYRTPLLRATVRLQLTLLFIMALLAPLLTMRPVAALSSQRIVYVKPDAPDTNSGESWESARSLQSALAAAMPGDEIWVAAGLYLPGALRTDTFTLQNDVALYGGFGGTESSRDERDPTTNVTVLSGDIDNNDTNVNPDGVLADYNDIVGNNAYNVVTGSGATSTAILDGFTISAGKANGGANAPCTTECGGGMNLDTSDATLSNLIFHGNHANTVGGGLYLFQSSPTLTNVTFTNNYAYGGGGMLNSTDSNPTLTNVTFTSNDAEDGGGMYNAANSNPTMITITFSDNYADHEGGGIYNVASSPQLTNVNFDDNWAYNNGGGMANVDGSNSTLTNVTFNANRANLDGGGMYNSASNPTLTDVTFTGNRATSNGGGMATREEAFFSTPTMLTNAIFSGNRAGGGGGGLYIYVAEVTLVNAVFAGNHAVHGGGIYSAAGFYALNNATFSQNSATEGSSVYNENTTFIPRFQNTIVWGDSSEEVYNNAYSGTRNYHSLVKGVGAEETGGTGNLDGTDPANAPLFVRPVDCGADGCTDNPATPADDEAADDDYGDLRLQAGSPTFDAGNNDLDLDGTTRPGTATTASIASDLAGQPRFIAVTALPAIVDLGAYEAAVVPPTADAGGPYSSEEGGSLNADASASSDDFGIVAYAWDCTANGSIDHSSAAPTGSSCTYLDDGNYSLRLIVTDTVDVTGTATAQVTVTNIDPTYTAALNQSGFAMSAKLFALGDFTDPGAEGSWSVTVDWGDSSAFTQFTVNGTGDLPVRSHTYANPGTYNVIVTVDDGEGDDDGGFEVNVNPAPPGAPTVTAAAAQGGTPDIEQSFALGSFGDPGSGGPWQVTVDWGDGSAPIQFSVTAPGQLPAKSHSFAAAGTYDVIVTVSDGTLESSASFRVTVGSAPGDDVIFLPAMRR